MNKDFKYADKLKTSLYWYLSKRRPFIVNNEYQIELLFIDKTNNSAKIQITNLKNNAIHQADLDLEGSSDERQ